MDFQKDDIKNEIDALCENILKSKNIAQDIDHNSLEGLFISTITPTKINKTKKDELKVKLILNLSLIHI